MPKKEISNLYINYKIIESKTFIEEFFKKFHIIKGSQTLLTSTDARITFSGIVISYSKIPSALTSRKTGSSFSSFVVGCHIRLPPGMIIGSSISLNPPISGGVGISVVVVVEVVVEGRGRVWVTVSLTREAVGRDIGESS